MHGWLFLEQYFAWYYNTLEIAVWCHICYHFKRNIDLKPTTPINPRHLSEAWFLGCMRLIRSRGWNIIKCWGCFNFNKFKRKKYSFPQLPTIPQIPVQTRFLPTTPNNPINPSSDKIPLSVWTMILGMHGINEIETIEFYFMTKNITSSINSKYTMI